MIKELTHQIPMEETYHLKKIITSLTTQTASNKNIINTSVLTGNLSKAILFAEVSEVDFASQIGDNLRANIDHINNNKIPESYIDGLSGFAHGAALLSVNKCSQDFIDEKDFCSLDNHLLKLAKFYLQKDNLDPFYGFIGVARYLLLRSEFNSFVKQEMSVLIKEFSEIVLKRISPRDNCEIDLSMSHGLSAVLSFIIDCKIFLNNKTRSDLIKKIASYILSFQEKGRIPDCVLETGVSQFSPLRWCHGDLSITYTLARAASEVGFTEIEAEILNIADNLCQLPSENQELYSATICHGTLGVAYIFEKLSRLYPEKENISMAKSFWWDKSFEILNSPTGYNYVDENGGAAQLSGLLNGIEGIGLVLASKQFGTNKYLDSFLQL